MTATHLGTFAPGSPDWHAARADGIGGSEIAAVLGLSPYESRFSLWHRKGGQLGPVELSDEMEWGTRLEPAILQKYIDEHPDQLVGTDPGTWSRDGWMIANPDAIADPATDDGSGIVETKISLFGDGFGDTGTEQVPLHYRIQVMWYMGVIGCRWATIAALVGYDYREYRIAFDAEEFQLLADAGAEFMRTLETNERPDIDAHSATYQAVRELHPDIDPADVDLTDDTAEAFIVAQAALKAAKADEQQARSVVADEMGDARRAVWSHGGDTHTIATRQARGDGTPYVVAGRKLPNLNPTPITEETEAA